MFYHYFIIFNWFSGIFGFWKPFTNPSKNLFLVLGSKIWPVLIMSCMIANYSTTKNTIRVLDVKSNLNQFVFLNQLLCNVGIVFIEMTNNKELCIILYQTVTKCFQSFRVTKRNLKYIALKLYFWFSIPTFIFVGAIVWEIAVTQKPPFVLLIKVPCFLTILHLVIHLYVILSVLKLVNAYLYRTLLFCEDFKSAVTKPDSKFRAMFYLLDINACFVDDDQSNLRFDIQYLCRIYDDLSTCMKLLEKYHGFQILLAIWLMFSNAVFGIPLVTSKQAMYPSAVIINASIAFSWFVMPCYIQDQIQKEVEITNNLIIKHLIDFRCDKPRKSMLQNFKQLVSVERLKFTACSLFELSYSMLVGTTLNIVTYSIILIQLVVSL